MSFSVYLCSSGQAASVLRNGSDFRMQTISLKYDGDSFIRDSMPSSKATVFSGILRLLLMAVSYADLETIDLAYKLFAI